MHGTRNGPCCGMDHSSDSRDQILETLSDYHEMLCLVGGIRTGLADQGVLLGIKLAIPLVHLTTGIHWSSARRL